jgi:hypothetical protein
MYVVFVSVIDNLPKDSTTDRYTCFDVDKCSITIMENGLCQMTNPSTYQWNGSFIQLTVQGNRISSVALMV